MAEPAELIQIYSELHRRNAVPPEHKATVDELVRRGVLGGGKPQYGPYDTLPDGTQLDDQGLERGNVLPIARDPNTNTLSPAVPGLIYRPFMKFREAAQTGTTTPGDALEMVGLSVAGLPRRPLASPTRESSVFGPGIRRAEVAQARAQEFTDVGVPAFAPAVSDTYAGPANALMSGMAGGPLRREAQRSIEGIENQVRNVLGETGATRSVNEIGTEAQEGLRRAITGRNDALDIPNMTAFQLQDISGVGPGPNVPRRAPPVTPTQAEQWNPRRRQVTPDEIDAAVIQPPRMETPPPRQIKPDEVPLPPELDRRLNDIKAAAEAARPWLSNEAEPRLEQLRRQVFPSVGLDVERLAQLGQPVNPASPMGRAYAEYQQLSKIVEKARATVREFDELSQMAQQERAKGWQAAQDAELARVSKDAESNYQMRLAEARRDAEERLNRVADAEYQNNLNDPARRTAFENQARNRARADTERRQNEADTAYVGELERRQATAIPGRVGGRSREPYMTEFDAGYEAARRNTPPVMMNPLGRPNDTQLTNTATLLDEIARGQRRQGMFWGYRDGQPFGDDGRLRPELLTIVERLAGGDVADRIRAMSDVRTRGAVQMGIRGLDEVRSLIGKALADARRSYGPEQTQRGDAAFLARLYDALGRDVEGVVATAPGGSVASRQRAVLRESYRTFMDEIRGPLGRLLGEQVTPEQAVRRLTEAARGGEQGNVDLLRAYFRVADEKGDRVRAAGVILNQMAEGGLDNFLASWRAMPNEVRRLMFQGDAQRIGVRLADLARVGGYLERFTRNARPDQSAMDVARRAASSQNVMTALMAFVHAPTAIAGFVGAAAASKLMAMPAFMRWLQKMPTTKTASERELILQRLMVIAATSNGKSRQEAIEAAKRESNE